MVTKSVGTAIAALVAAIDTGEKSAVAISGGVDSMTLAVLAGRHVNDVHMFHAISPAVPPEATERVTAYARQEGWQLELLDAGEFEDPQYRANPVNRCYFCKTNLYGAMAAHTDRTLWSGTNTDDLGDYRPGLRAAAEHQVRHPYVEANIDKATVRAIARAYDLDDLSELPAAPCLSSRVQTGIAIDARDLTAIHGAETAIRRTLAPQTVRCRVRDAGVVIELDAETLSGLGQASALRLGKNVRALFEGHRPGVNVSFSVYAMGSAFVHGPPTKVPS